MVSRSEVLACLTVGVINIYVAEIALRGQRTELVHGQDGLGSVVDVDLPVCRLGEVTPVGGINLKIIVVGIPLAELEQTVVGQLL